jgi:type I restriction-modification system DNA methylase subunit
LDDKDGYIDLLWKGMILIEMKSRGKNLDKAFDQAKAYLHGLKEHELPKYILVSDFEHFRLYDLEETKTIEFKLHELINNVQHFAYLLGYQKIVYKEQDPANIQAAELMGKLHDRLAEIGYTGPPLEVYLVRLLFCLFAEDTTIFEKQQFQEYLEQRTNPDGSDLAPKLQELFQVLNTPKEKRFKNLDEQLAAFPYVNGKLFEDNLPTASFDSKMRQALLNCCYLDWSKISPAIFGSMFQSVMNPKERRNLGAHYTSETNILKLIKPLFLDELWKEFESIKENKNKLKDFQTKLSRLKFLDPACGCGNFLIITYRELRLLELEVLRALKLNKHGQGVLAIEEILKLQVDQFYGIEYEEFPARIAEVAMWLVDHQMNMMVSHEFGQYYVRLPLTKAANIVHGNALRMDWKKLIEQDPLDLEASNTTLILQEEQVEYKTVNIKTENLTVIDQRPAPQSSYYGAVLPHFDYIIGNPPFIGKNVQQETQKADMEKVFAGVKEAGVLDYVTAWYLKAAQLIQNTKTKVAFVSSNSISQGEQVGVLWNILLNYYNIKIHFAHRTFSWMNEAKGNAAVHCVIIGFAHFDTPNKTIFEYKDIKGKAHEIKAKNINPYLIDAKDILLAKRKSPICSVPEISFGSMPNDGGNFLFTDEEKIDFIAQEPQSEKFFRPLISAHEFLNGHKRWCLWLKNADPTELKQAKLVMERVERVRKLRAESPRQATQKLAAFPTLFGEDRQPKSSYVLIPLHSSENRKYIPIGFFDQDSIANNSCSFIPNAGLYHFGVLMSSLHMAWIKTVCGRLESRFRYSNEIVYNNFPWPENPTEKQIKAIELAAQKVLDSRAEFPNASLADLYDPLSMPAALIKAHSELDKAVDLAYRAQAFTAEANRMEFLFGLYEKYTAGLFRQEKKKK